MSNTSSLKPASTIQRDVIAGTIVFLIALPLCLGIAQASGATPLAGIVSGVVGGVIIGLVSRSNLSVSGPAAGLIAIVAAALAKMPYEAFLCAVILAGIFQIVLGIAKAGGLANYLPSSVIEGMLAGIGLTIIIKELPNAVGFARAAQHEVATEGERSFNWLDVRGAFEHVEPAAMLISGTGLLILIFWLVKPIKKLQLIPAGLLVVIVGTLINEILRGTGALPALSGDRLVEMPVPRSLGDLAQQIRFPDWHALTLPVVWSTAAILAVVASVESLLCIEATDKLDPLRRYTPGSTELRAQGIGNIVSGFLGGLPLTSVIIRSSANINAGARTKRSTIIHGTLLFVAVVTLGSVINRIPEAALSAILIFTGYRLCRPSVFRHMWKEGGATQFVPFVVTVGLVAWRGLLEGVAVGLVLALIFTLRQNMRIPYFYQRSLYSNGELIKLTLAQEVSFLNKGSIKETLEHLPSGSKVIIDASHTEYIDFDVLDILRDFQRSTAPEKGISLSLVGFKEVYKVPASLGEEEVARTFVGHPEVPKRSAGGYQKLMDQLRGRKEKAGVEA